MSTSTVSPPAGTRGGEVVFRAKSLWHFCAPCTALGLAILGVALVIGLDGWAIQARLQIAPEDARAAALVIGGFGAIFVMLFPCIALAGLKWMAVSDAGIHWQAGRTVHERGWDQYVGVQRGYFEMRVNGQRQTPAYYADVQFRTGRPVRVSNGTVPRYDELVAAIQTQYEAWLTSRSAGTWCGVAQPARPHLAALAARETYGPLRLDSDGVEWDGVYRRWNDIKLYEVAHGLLRIEATDGTEFLRRVEHLGDWKLALARMDVVCGYKRVGKGAGPR